MKTLPVLLLSLFTTALTAQAQFAIDWYTVDGGGGVSSGGNFTISGTIGQPDAGTMTGGTYSLQGGFWPGIVVPPSGEAPTLFIQFLGGSVVLSWAPNTAGFSLQQSDSLSAPSWSGGPAGNPTAPITPTPSARFYRLIKP